jgi:3-oxoacyl-[acyl-carrier protein] reductase
MERVMSNLKSKVALVTGGSRGIGAAIARRLAKDGAAVALTYAGSAERAAEVIEEIQAAGGRAIALRADAGDAAAVRAAVAKTVEALGRLDILVNNAGVLVAGPFDDLELEDIDRSLAVNVRGVLVATQAAAAHMTSGGRVINIGSINSDFVPGPGVALYAATKGAVASLTRGLARELGPRGITINNVQPGPVDTDMNPADGPFAAHLLPLIATGRYGRGDEVASLVAYLASEEAAYVTGANLRIDGGFGS